MRYLFDQNFLESGCPEEEYDPVYRFDDTVATYATDFAVMAVCWAAALKLFLSRRNGVVCKLMIGYFFFYGSAFGVGGFQHLFIHVEDHPKIGPTTKSFQCFACVASTFLLVAVLWLATANTMILRVTAILGFLISIYPLITLEPYRVVPSYLIIAAACAVIIYGRQATKKGQQDGACLFNSIKVFSILLQLAGGFVQVTLRDICGLPSYRDCFWECPLPNPSKFNHDALFHVLFLIGTVFFAIAEDRLPTLPLQQAHDKNDTQNSDDSHNKVGIDHGTSSEPAIAA